MKVIIEYHDPQFKRYFFRDFQHSTACDLASVPTLIELALQMLLIAISGLILFFITCFVSEMNAPD